MTKQKIFIIGLPRTATTSVCVAMLELGFKTAHTAYTNQAMNDAQVIADTPVFCDYQLLDKTYPNAKFIYLTREFSSWLPSITILSPLDIKLRSLNFFFKFLTISNSLLKKSDG